MVVVVVVEMFTSLTRWSTLLCSDRTGLDDYCMVVVSTVCTLVLVASWWVDKSATGLSC